jgi:hypothetical protein
VSERSRNGDRKSQEWVRNRNAVAGFSRQKVFTRETKLHIYRRLTKQFCTREQNFVPENKISSPRTKFHTRVQNFVPEKKILNPRTKFLTRVQNFVHENKISYPRIKFRPPENKISSQRTKFRPREQNFVPR